MGILKDGRKASYWSIHLDEASQEITTFRTPFGRYCYRRLPFGLCVSQDLFQQAMDRILARAPGCVGIADDVVVYGRNNAEHDTHLLRLMQVAKEEGLVFNSKKCAIKTNEIVFFGYVYDKDGVKPDPSKLEDIRKMPTPQDREDLQRFIGLINYLAAYIPHFADKVSPLRELLKKDVPFVWHEDHQHTIRHRDRSQTFAHDTQQAAEECTSASTTTPGQYTGIRLSARVSTW